jgi:hypothetical protein
MDGLNVIDEMDAAWLTFNEKFRFPATRPSACRLYPFELELY